MDGEKSIAMVCLCAVAVVAIIFSGCDFTIVAGCAGAIATLGGVAWGSYYAKKN